MSMLNEERAEELLAFTAKMIQAPSYSDQGDLVVDVMKEFCNEHRSTDIHMNRYGDCIYHTKGSRPDPKVLFDGYMDMVSAPDKTKRDHDPFGAEIVDDRMYGRGTPDMKNALSVMLVTALYHAGDADYDFSGDIYIAGVVHEECFEGVATEEISAYVEPDYVIISETPQLNMKISQKDCAEIMVETLGIPAHSASPHKGVSAVYKTCEVIGEINRLIPPHHDVLGDGILELVDVESSSYPGASVAPDYCHATYDRCLLIGRTKEGVLAPLQEFLDGMMKEDPQLKAKVSYAVGQEKCRIDETIEAERFFPRWLFDKNEDWVQNIHKEMKEIGLNPTITNYDFCASTSHHVGEVGIRSVSVGPSLETLAYIVNEYTKIGQLSKVMESYHGVMKALLK